MAGNAQQVTRLLSDGTAQIVLPRLVVEFERGEFEVPEVSFPDESSICFEPGTFELLGRMTIRVRGTGPAAASQGQGRRTQGS